jgi:hypothetical protein
MIQFCCSGCNSAIEVPEDRGGDMISCPRCGQPTRVPTFLPIEPATDPSTSGVRSLATGSSFHPATVWLGKKRFSSMLAFPVCRFGSWALLLLALLLFPLPWVQVQCNGPIGNSRKKVLVEQSGLQMVYGGYSENPLLRDPQFEGQRRSVERALSVNERMLPGSMWIMLCVLFLVNGILAGILVRSDALRSALLIGCGVSTGLVLLVQARMGFPLERALPETVVKRIRLGETIGIELSSGTLLETRYTGWFWLIVSAVLGSLAAACIESWIMRPNHFRNSRQH